MMKLKFFSKLLDKRIAAYQRELIETHYKEVDNMYRQMRGCGTITGDTSRP